MFRGSPARVLKELASYSSAFVINPEIAFLELILSATQVARFPRGIPSPENQTTCPLFLPRCSRVPSKLGLGSACPSAACALAETRGPILCHPPPAAPHRCPVRAPPTGGAEGRVRTAVPNTAAAGPAGPSRLQDSPEQQGSLEQLTHGTRSPRPWLGPP